MASPYPAPRMVITTHKNDGVSIFARDTVAAPFQPFGPGRSAFNSFHSAPTVPVSNQVALPELGTSLPRCPPAGVLFCNADYAPNSSVPMHRTLSIDYAVILEGEIVIRLDGGREKTLRKGDVVVQRGTNHEWHNRTDQWCRCMFVMVGSEAVKLGDGTVLEETVFKKGQAPVPAEAVNIAATEKSRYVQSLPFKRICTEQKQCDEGRPSCNRCIQRGEVCFGYRDPQTTYLFKSENERTATLVSRKAVRRRASSQALTSSSRERTNSHSTQSSSFDDNELEAAAQNLNLGNPYPWLKTTSQSHEPSVEKRAVDKFFEKFVMFPCNSASSSGFLEQLPCLFEEVQTEGRVALRWAVRAVSFASLGHEQGSEELGRKATVCYGKALEALGDTLRNKAEAVSDYTLMTIVVLDLFETIYVQDPTSRGSHTEGMAQILRLRGPDQLYSARGWSLYRLANHRLQRQQLTFDSAPPISEDQEALLASLTNSTPSNRISHDTFAISKICSRARELRSKLTTSLSEVETLALIKEMHTLDHIATSWRVGPSWSFRTVSKRDMPNYPASFPDQIQLHHDAWIAYEWNYHRCARIILHTHLLECVERLLSSLSLASHSYASPPSSVSEDESPTFEELQEYYARSRLVISWLADGILATVPQSLGDIDSAGNLLTPPSEMDGEVLEDKRTLQGVGAYFLMWPIKIVKSHKHLMDGQREMAEEVFERIREVTGMKKLLGDKSCI
ncbi:hypothetical protein LSUE1_G001291 [Lachnellula suecica]|uniref:Cupin type-2 domain-containing protein n=1 Tax=Lachnellula suecica TaxID=602035 RepID=A0A8T9CLA7_9HELO|nr:hypothetical protein LSUE1_G001291 [Lachnellula suecica]